MVSSLKRSAKALVSLLCLLGLGMNVSAADGQKAKKDIRQRSTSRIEVRDVWIHYLTGVTLRAELVFDNDDRSNVGNTKVFFDIDGKPVGSVESGPLGHAELQLDGHNSRQLNLQVGQHQITAFATDRASGRKVQANGTLTVKKAWTELSNLTDSKWPKAYKLGETVPLTGKLFHSRYPEDRPSTGQSGGDASAAPGGPYGLHRGFPQGSSSEPAPPYSPLPLTNVDVKVHREGFPVVVVRTNNHGYFELPLVLTEGTLKYEKESFCTNSGIYSTSVWFEFPGDTNYDDGRSETVNLQACPTGTVKNGSCCD